MAVLTQAQVLSNFQAVDSTITDSQHLLLIGPDAIARKHTTAALKAGLSLGSYTGSQIVAAWPLLGAGENVDLTSPAVFIENAARQFYTEASRPIADAGSILANTTNRLRFSDRVLKTANGSTRASQIPVDVAVGDWVRVTNASATTITTKVAALIADVVAATTGTATAVAGNVGTPTVASGGTYTGTTATTYTIRVTTGGATSGSVAQISVTTSTGIDQSGPHFVSTTVAIPIGSLGITVTLTGATLTANDAWTIAVTPASGGVNEVGGAIRTMVLENYLETTAAAVASLWTGTSITAYFGIYGNVTVNRGKTGLAPAVNWTAAASTITLSTTIVMRDTRTGTLDLPVLAGTAYVDYRAIRTAHANTMNRVSTPADLTALGMDYTDSSNTLAFTANLCFDPLRTRALYILPIQSDDLAGYTAAHPVHIEHPNWSSVCPLTSDATIINTLIADVNSRSNNANQLWSDLVIHQPYSLLQTIVKLRSDSSLSTATIADNPATGATDYTLVTDTLGQFLTKGVLAGDTVRAAYSSDGFGTETYASYTVASVISEQQLVLLAGPSSAVTVASRYEIWRTLTATQALTNAGSTATAYANSKVIPVFGDATGTTGITLSNYMVAAVVAAERTYAAPHQNLVTTQLAQLATVPSSVVFAGLYTAARSYGMYVLRQLYTGEVIIDSAYTSVINDPELKFDNVQRNLGSQLRYLSGIFARRRGRSNNIENTLATLTTDFKSAILFLKSASQVTDLGSMLIDGALTALDKNPLRADALDASFTLTVPAPLNDIDFTIDLTIG